MSMPGDVEQDLIGITYVKGYASLANFIASDPDKSTALYRRFDFLSARNLLYMQSELAELEKAQRAFDIQDRARTTDEKVSAKCWQTFKSCAQDPGNEYEKKRMKLAMDIRRNLKEYREALLLESSLLSLRGPSSRVFSAFRNEFHSAGGPGSSVPTLEGSSSTLYDNPKDLVALTSSVEDDRLTKILRTYFPVLFVTHTTDHPLIYISENRIRFAVAILNVILVALLLFGAVYILYYIKDDEKRLGLVAAFTVAFSGCIGLLTTATRSEVFAACAAYAAVLVVFVSGNLKSS